MASAPGNGPTVENRWWAEVGAPKEPVKPSPSPRPLPGARFFKIAEGYDQDEARDHLTNSNFRLLQESCPSPGTWGYVSLLPHRFPARELSRVKRLVPLPPYAAAVVVDSGRSIRLLATGNPIGERILELTLLKPPSFDCWVEHEWVREELYTSLDQALRRFRQHIRDYLSPQALAHSDAVRARA